MGRVGQTLDPQSQCTGIEAHPGRTTRETRLQIMGHYIPYYSYYSLTLIFYILSILSIPSEKYSQLIYRFESILMIFSEPNRSPEVCLIRSVSYAYCQSLSIRPLVVRNVNCFQQRFGLNFNWVDAINNRLTLSRLIMQLVCCLSYHVNYSFLY